MTDPAGSCPAPRPAEPFAPGTRHAALPDTPRPRVSLVGKNGDYFSGSDLAL